MKDPHQISDHSVKLFSLQCQKADPLKESAKNCNFDAIFLLMVTVPDFFSHIDKDAHRGMPYRHAMWRHQQIGSPGGDVGHSFLLQGPLRPP